MGMMSLQFEPAPERIPREQEKCFDHGCFYISVIYPGLYVKMSIPVVGNSFDRGIKTKHLYSVIGLLLLGFKLMFVANVLGDII